MRTIGRVLLLFGWVPALLGGSPLTIPEMADQCCWSIDRGTVKVHQAGGNPRVSIDGVTANQKATSYFKAQLKLKAPISLEGKRLKFTISSSTPGALIVIAVRTFNQALAKPNWFFSKWGELFVVSNSLELSLSTGNGGIFKWNAADIDGVKADRIDRLEIWIGSITPDVKVNAEISDLIIEDACAALPHPEKPVYSDRPAQVRHPAGSIKSVDIERTRNYFAANRESRETLAKIREYAGYFSTRDAAAIELMIPDAEAWIKCLCPNCGTQPEYAWSARGVLQADMKSIRCSQCKMVFPNEKFPEDKLWEVRNVYGEIRKIPYYQGPDQIGQGENWGNKYFISGVANQIKLRNTTSIIYNAMLYAITGELAQAETCRAVLLRFARIYPKLAVKYRTRVYHSPLDEQMAGKFCGWKFHDSVVIASLAETYTMTVPSGVYSDADRVAIENGIFREYKWLITANPPTHDIFNAVPSHYTAAALCAAILGDHELLNWVLDGPDGFKAFTRKYYHRDGTWFEDSPGYAEMANNPLPQLIATLDGYSDSAEYRGADRYDRLDVFGEIPGLELILRGMAPATLPTGFLPATNDSAYRTAQNLDHLELANQIRPCKENWQLLQYMKSILPPSSRIDFSIFKRDYGNAAKTEPPEAFVNGRIFSGSGWGILRTPESFKRASAVLHFGPNSGGHAHNSTLNFFYFDQGKELSCDIGYLGWFHPTRPWNISALAHNLVVIDGKPQAETRAGTLEFADLDGEIQAIRAEAKNAYPDLATDYSRMLLYLPLSGGERYTADFFSVGGGREHFWIFHADGEAFHSDIPFAAGFEFPLGKELGADFVVVNGGADISRGAYHSQWTYGDGIVTRQTLYCAKSLRMFWVTGSGQRDKDRPYEKKQLHILVAQSEGPQNLFVSALAANNQIGIAELAADNGGRAFLFDHKDGRDIVIIGRPDGGQIKVREFPQLECSGRTGLVRLDRKGDLKTLWCEAGSIGFGGQQLNAGRAMVGRVKEISAGGFVAETCPADRNDCKLVLFSAYRDGIYRIRGINGNRITLDSDEVIRFRVGDAFQMVPSAQKEY